MCIYIYIYIYIYITKLCTNAHDAGSQDARRTMLRAASSLGKEWLRGRRNPEGLRDVWEGLGLNRDKFQPLGP